MFTEDWKPRYNNGQNNEGQNRERRPYQSNRPSYGNHGSYGRPDNRNSYNRTGSGNYDRPPSGHYDRPPSGNYDRPPSGNYDRPPRPNYNNSNYSPRPYDNYQGDGQVKKRRPRVGEIAAPVRSGGYDDRRWAPRQQDSYSRPGPPRPSQR